MAANFDLWKLLAGLGMFLFGMYQMEDAVKALSGKFFRRMISRWTLGSWGGDVGSGTVITAILQSSSAMGNPAFFELPEGVYKPTFCDAEGTYFEAPKECNMDCTSFPSRSCKWGHLSVD